MMMMSKRWAMMKTNHDENQPWWKPTMTTTITTMGDDNDHLQKFCQENRDLSHTKISPSCAVSILAQLICNTLYCWWVDFDRRICAPREPGLPPVIQNSIWNCHGFKRMLCTCCLAYWTKVESPINQWGDASPSPYQNQDQSPIIRIRSYVNSWASAFFKP